MKHLIKITSGAFIGIGIGFTLNLLVSYFYGVYSPGVPSFLNQFDTTLIAVSIQMLIYMALGIIQSYSVNIMNNQKRSLLSNTIIHFLVVVLPLLLASYLLHWSNNLLGLVSVAIFISIVYALIWAIMYLNIRSDIKKINHNIEIKNE